MSEINPTFDSFRLHDERGFPLTVALHAAKEIGLQINLAAFACDALGAGWTEEKIQRTLGEACADNGIPFSWDAFMGSMARLHTASRAHSSATPWATMKQFIVKTPGRANAAIPPPGFFVPPEQAV